jgi:hypothetical protein
MQVVASRLGGDPALLGQFEVEPMSVPAHCPFRTLGKRESLAQLPRGLPGQHGQVGGQQDDGVGGRGVKRVRVEMPLVDDEQGSFALLVGQSPEQSAQHSCAAPIGEDVPGFVKPVGGKPHIRAGTQSDCSRRTGSDVDTRAGRQR